MCEEFVHPSSRFEGLKIRRDGNLYSAGIINNFGYEIRVAPHPQSREKLYKYLREMLSLEPEEIEAAFETADKT